MNRPVVSLIVAVAQNGVIGRGDALPWHLPDELRHFKATTMGHHVVMGRKTHQSIGRPLPGRVNVVVTRNRAFEAPGCVVVHDLEGAFDVARAAGEDEVFVVGGAALYADALRTADRIYLTRVHASVEGDVVFPQIDASWVEVSAHHHPADDRHAHGFTRCVLERNPPASIP